MIIIITIISVIIVKTVENIIIILTNLVLKFSWKSNAN